MLKAEIIVIADEVLIGDVLDTNSNYIAGKLKISGIKLNKTTVIADDKTVIINTVKNALNNADLVFITGGLGPTEDDLTRFALAELFNVKLIFNETVYNKIKQMFISRNIPVTDNNKVQAFFPENSIVIENRFGSAPGIQFNLESNKYIFSMPGVPYETEQMFDETVLPFIKSLDNYQIGTLDINVIGIGESAFFDKLKDFDQIKSLVKVASLPKSTGLLIRCTSEGYNQTEIEDKLKNAACIFEKSVKEYIAGYNEKSHAAILISELKKKHMTLSTAESCTGGLISSSITDVPGSSEVFKSGFVTYSNQSKIAVLGVNEKTIAEKGAVSSETVDEMLTGALSITNSDTAIAVSGIAGPDGGTAEKPVGTVFIGCAVKTGKREIIRYELRGNRKAIKERTTSLAIALLLKIIRERS